MSEAVSLQVSDGLAVITLDDPEHGNVISPHSAGDLIEAAHHIDHDPTIGVALLQAAGEDFCLGAATRVLADVATDPTTPAALEVTAQIYDAFRCLGQLTVPTIVAAQGRIFGGGLNLALAADVLLVAEDAVLLSGFGRVGLHAGGGHFSLLGRATSRSVATAVGVLGRPISGRRAAEVGLAWAATPATELHATARDLAHRAAADPELTRAHIRSLRTELGPPALPWEAAIQVEANAQLRHLIKRPRHHRPVAPTDHRDPGHPSNDL